MWRLRRAGSVPIDLSSYRCTSERVAGLEPEAEFFKVVIEHVTVHQGARHRFAASGGPRHLPERGHGDEEFLAAIMQGRTEVITAVRFVIEDKAVVFVLVNEFESRRPVLDKPVRYREGVVDIGFLLPAARGTGRVRRINQVA